MTHPDLCPYCRAPISPTQRQRINDTQADKPAAPEPPSTTLPEENA